MSDFLTILDNHRELLEERGYDEIGLGSPDEPGLFMKKLEYLFSDCISKSMHDKEKQNFFIEAVGFFDNDKDLVSFKFHYEFDPIKKNIDLKSISTRMDETFHVVLIGPNMYHLPNTLKVYKTLCDKRQMEIGRRMEKAKELINHIPAVKGRRCCNKNR